MTLYYLTICRRTCMASIEKHDVYFNSEDAMQNYRDKFQKYLYRENERFIQKSGKAHFNDAGVLVNE